MKLKNIINIGNVLNLKDTGEGAFIGCSSLKSIELPENLEFIGVDAFRGCSS